MTKLQVVDKMCIVGVQKDICLGLRPGQDK